MLGNWADRFYVHTIEDIRDKQRQVEEPLFESQQGVEAAVRELVMKDKSSSVTEVTALLTKTSKDESEASLRVFSQFLMTMIAKYKDGQRVDDFHAEVMIEQ